MNIHLHLRLKMRIRDEIKESAIKLKAIEMIVENGFDGLSMQKLAKAAGVSPATIYIYFKDRDDLIEKIAIEEADRMTQITLKDFSPEMSFEEGLWKQWENRVAFWLEHPLRARFLEQIKHSPIGFKIQGKVKQEFVSIMRLFAKKAVERKELIPMQPEIYWALAYSPLYQLIKFHLDGRGLNNEPFVLDQDLLKQTFRKVIKSLKP